MDLLRAQTSGNNFQMKNSIAHGLTAAENARQQKTLTPSLDINSEEKKSGQTSNVGIAELKKTFVQKTSRPKKSKSFHQKIEEVMIYFSFFV